MSVQTLSIINKATSPKKEKYSILTFDTHERYQSVLALTGHDFYGLRYDGCKTWDETYAKRPDNYYFLNGIYTGIDYDFILAQSKFGQLQVAKQIQGFLRIPIIFLEHTVPTKDLGEHQIHLMKQLWGDVNVFISDYSAQQWNPPINFYVAYHSTDPVFQPEPSESENPYILSVVNDFIRRDYCCNYEGWKRVVNGLPHKIVGNTPGLSEPAKSKEELAKEYNNCAVFFNSSTESTVPTVLFEAMACGKPVVSTATCAIPTLIEHGVNGFLSNDEEELKKYLQLLLDDPEMRNRMGQEARKTIEKKYSQEKFIKTWNYIFDKTYEVKR